LCNQHGEGVLDGLCRLHPWYAPALLIAAFVMGHFYQSYMAIGVGEVTRNLLHVGEVWQWAIVWNAIAFWLVFWPSYPRLEVVFKVLLAVLSISFVGSALWVGFSVQDLLLGLVRLEVPEQKGKYDPLIVGIAMIGAVGGSLMNLVYPYFIEAKGWRGPAYRKLQFYDFLLAVTALIVLNLSVWILGAELLYPDKQIEHLDDLPQLLYATLGEKGRTLFYLGIFAAVYTSVLGHAMGLACLGSHAWLRWQAGNAPLTEDFRKHPLYRAIVVWSLTTPVVWTIPGMPGFVKMTLIANSAQVVMLPFLAGGLWWITASPQHIGEPHRNRWWENVVMAALFALAIYGAYGSIKSVLKEVGSNTRQTSTEVAASAEAVP